MKHFMYSLIIGLVSAVAVYLTIRFKMPTWVLFMAWVSFYVFGQSLKEICLACVQIILGIIIAILIMLSGQWLNTYAGQLAMPIAVAIIITILISGISILKPLTVVPAYFMGMIIFFGLNEVPTAGNLAIMVIIVVCGFFFAWLAEFLGKLFSVKVLQIKNKHFR